MEPAFTLSVISIFLSCMSWVLIIAPRYFDWRDEQYIKKLRAKKAQSSSKQKEDST